MIATVHIITGAAIATHIRPLWLGFGLAFLSHYFLDAIPHQDYCIKNIENRNWRNSFGDFFKVGLDFAVAGFLVFLFAPNFVVAALAGFLAMAPDGLTLLHFVFPNSYLLASQAKFQRKVHSVAKLKARSTFVTAAQTIILIVALAALASLPV